MNFDLSPQQRALQEAARRFAETELPAVAKELEESGEAPSKRWLKRYAELGFLGCNLPVEAGGLGLSNLDAMIVLEEFAKISVAVAFPVFESVGGPIHVVSRFASPEVARPLVRKVCGGEAVVAVSMSEPNAGTALTDLTTKGRVQGDEIVVTGQKRWCSGAGHADAYLVYCRLSNEPGAKGIGAVLIDKGTPGMTFGSPEQLMGFRGVASADIFLDDVRVPLNRIIVPAGGFSRLMEVFDLERCSNATMSLGLAAAALSQSLRYVEERKQFGKQIAEFQAVQIRLAEMAMKVEAARLLIWHAVARNPDLPLLADTSIAKCFANEMVREVCGHAVQLMGGYGYQKEFGAEQRLRDAWGWGIAGGTIDIQKVNIAGSLLGRRFSQRD